MVCLWWTICLLISDFLYLIGGYQYIRETTSVEVDDNITTINSAGGCGIAEGGPSIWTFVGPLIAVHAGLMISTNVILYKVRNINDRYQEHKYVALASIFVCELLVVGLPVLVAVGDNPVAIFSVISGVVALNDIGILCFVFIPKMKYQRKGIDEGVAVGETIMKDTHKKALNREHHRRSLSNLSQSHVSGISGASASTDDDCNGGQISRTNSRQLPDRKLSLCSLSFDSEDVIAEEPGEDNDIESCYVMRKAESVQTESPGSPETAPCGYEEDRKKDGDSNRAVFEHRKYDAILKENEDLRRELEEMKRRARHLHNGLSTELENLVE